MVANSAHYLPYFKSTCLSDHNVIFLLDHQVHDSLNDITMTPPWCYNRWTYMSFQSLNQGWTYMSFQDWTVICLSKYYMFSWQVCNKMCNNIAHFCLFVTKLYLHIWRALFNACIILGNNAGNIANWYTMNTKLHQSVCWFHLRASVTNIFHLAPVTRHCWTFKAKVKLTKCIFRKRRNVTLN